MEIENIPDDTVIVATGPLTSDALAEELGEITGKKNLFFYDAISPIVDGETIDMNKAFFGSRYLEIRPFSDQDIWREVMIT